MFNIAFPELLVILTVAVIVIGPEKLPKIAKGLGLFLGKMQRQVNAIKNEINAEIRNEDLKKLEEELQRHSMGLNEDLRKGMMAVETVLQNSEELRNNEKTAQDSETHQITTAGTEKADNPPTSSPPAHPESTSKDDNNRSTSS